MYWSQSGNIYFVEGRPPKSRDLGAVSVEVGGAFQHAQLRTLDDVKRAMAGKVRVKGGNAVIDFKYGQKSVGFWRSLFHTDDVTWYGSGRIATISASDLNV